MAGGRPTKYDPTYCDRVIEYGKEGMSLHEMALELDVAPSTLFLWRETHPECSEAIKKAVEYSQGWWEKLGRSAAAGGVPNFNATAYIFNKKNRFAADWRDKQEVAQTVKVEAFKWEDE